jgi:hypothetical protein
MTDDNNMSMMTKSAWPRRNDGEKVHWSEMFKVHPAAAVFPMLPDDELNELAEDVKANGLQQNPVLWCADRTDPREPIYLLDGRNRLEASMRADIDLLGIVEGATGWLLPTARFLSADDDPVAFVISANIRRRHLTKEDQAHFIVAARTAANSEQANLARSEKRKFPGGTTGGSTKNPVREQVMQDCSAAGISERTAKRAWDKRSRTDLPKNVKSKTEPAPAPAATKAKTGPKAASKPAPKKWRCGVDRSAPKRARIEAVWELMAHLNIEAKDLEE